MLVGLTDVLTMAAGVNLTDVNRLVQIQTDTINDQGKRKLEDEHRASKSNFEGWIHLFFRFAAGIVLLLDSDVAAKRHKKRENKNLYLIISIYYKIINNCTVQFSTRQWVLQCVILYKGNYLISYKNLLRRMRCRPSMLKNSETAGSLHLLPIISGTDSAYELFLIILIG